MLQRDREIRLRIGVARLELHGPEQMRLRFRVIAKVHVNNAEAVVHRSRLAIERERPPVELERWLSFAVLLVRRPEKAEILRVVGFSLDCSRVVLDG